MNGLKPTVTIRINLDIVLEGEKEQKLLKLLLEHGAVVSEETITTPEVTEKAEPTIAEELVEVIKKTAAKVDSKSTTKLKVDGSGHVVPKPKRKKNGKGTPWDSEQDRYLLNMWNKRTKKRSGGRGFTYKGKEHRKMNRHFGTKRTQASIVQRLWNLLNKR